MESSSKTGTTSFDISRFERIPVVGIMRNFPAAAVEAVVHAYAEAGLSTLEITMNSPDATGLISKLRAAYDGRLNIGAGTVRTKADLEKAIAAGAQFIVTPLLDKGTIKAAVKAGIPVFPGAMTPTEIGKAWDWGATAVKVFPAGRLGAGYLKDVLEPLNDIKLLPTGGVSPDNMHEFTAAGAYGVGMGSALFPKEMIAQQDWVGLAAFYKAFVTRIKSLIADKKHGL